MHARRPLLTGLAMAVAAGVFFTASTFMSRGVEPFYTWYYVFAWWSYILFVESLLHRQNAPSLLYDEPRRFLKLLPVSVTVWLIFEMLNFRLQNWGYLHTPANLPLRWAGYAVSYATVFPAIFATRELLQLGGVFSAHTVKPLRVTRPLLWALALLGGVMTVMPMAAPQYFFPLVWVGPLLLLEPLVYARGGKSLLAEWESGSIRTTLQLLLAGLICGFLWELWNFWAGAKWFYTVPFVGNIKLFEMPVLGFLGFPPFALECWAFAQAFLLLDGHVGALDRKQRLRTWAALIVGMVVFWALVMHGIDRFTVAAFAKPLL